MKVLRHLIYQFRLASAVLSITREVDVVFFHVGGTQSFIPVLATRLSSANSVVIVTGDPPESYRAQNDDTLLTRIVSALLEVVEKSTCVLASEVIVLSETMRQGLVPEWSSTGRHVGNLNYIDINELGLSPAVDSRSTDLIFVGRFTSEKGIQRFVKSLPDLVRRYPDLAVELVGDGPLKDELAAFVAEKGLQDNVEFAGWKGKEEVYKRLKNGRLLVIPSFSEGVPKVLLEGMACGTVPVASDVGGVGDVVRDGQNGILIQDNQKGTLVESVQDALEREDLQKMSDAARETIEENFSFKSAREAYLHILNEAKYK
mgnify:CR=1 FL=1